MTLWHKPAYTALDRDAATGDLLPGALPPGLYCEDEEAFAKLRAGARLRGSAVRGSTLTGMWDLAGQQVFVCTPEQARTFRAIASKAPPPPVEPEPDPLAGIEEEAAKLHALMAPKPAPRPAAPPPATRHPFHGANRQQRRAAEARARRRA